MNAQFNTRFAIGNMSNWFPLNPGNWTSKDNMWHFRQSIDYSVTANRAILDFASRYRETNLYRIYQMGRDEVKWGSEDHWTFTPHKTAKVEQAACGTWTVPTAANPRRRLAAPVAARARVDEAAVVAAADAVAAPAPGFMPHLRPRISAIRADSSSRRASRISDRPCAS